MCQQHAAPTARLQLPYEASRAGYVLLDYAAARVSDPGKASCQETTSTATAGTHDPGRHHLCWTLCVRAIRTDIGPTAGRAARYRLTRRTQHNVPSLLDSPWTA